MLKSSIVKRSKTVHAYPLIITHHFQFQQLGGFFVSMTSCDINLRHINNHQICINTVYVAKDLGQKRVLVTWPSQIPSLRVYNLQHSLSSGRSKLQRLEGRTCCKIIPGFRPQVKKFRDRQREVKSPLSYPCHPWELLQLPKDSQDLSQATFATLYLKTWKDMSGTLKLIHYDTFILI